MTDKVSKEALQALNARSTVMKLSYLELAALDKSLRFTLSCVSLEKQGKKYLSSHQTGKCPFKIEIDQYEIAALKHFLDRKW